MPGQWSGAGDVVASVTERRAETPRCWQGHAALLIHLWLNAGITTYYSVFIGLRLRLEVLCTPAPLSLEFAIRLTSLATFGENRSNPWRADKTSQYRALSLHGGFSDQAAL
jgi:hypothetical protein